MDGTTTSLIPLGVLSVSCHSFSCSERSYLESNPFDSMLLHNHNFHSPFKHAFNKPLNARQKKEVALFDLLF